MADKQLEATRAAAAFQKQWFARRCAGVCSTSASRTRSCRPTCRSNCSISLDMPAVSNQWWSSLVAAKRQAPAFLDAMDADGFPDGLCRYCSLGYATTRYAGAGEPPWGGLPTPRLLCARLTCDCIQRVFSLWAEAFGAELFEIDHPGAAELPPRWWELGRHRWRELVRAASPRLRRRDARAAGRTGSKRSRGRRLDRDGAARSARAVNRQEEIFDAARELIAAAPATPGAHDGADHQRDGHAMGARHRLGARARASVSR